MAKHDYEKEILKILSDNDNCILGFNKMLKLGSGKGFNPNFLKQYLENMQKDGLIKTKMIGNKLEITRVVKDFEDSFSDFTKDLDSIDTKLYRKNLSHQERFELILDYLTIAFSKNRELLLGLLYNKYVINSKRQANNTENARKKLLLSIESKFSLLKDDQKERMLDHLLGGY